MRFLADCFQDSSPCQWPRFRSDVRYRASSDCFKGGRAAFALHRIKQAPAESNGVRLVQSQSCDHYTRGQYG